MGCEYDLYPDGLTLPNEHSPTWVRFWNLHRPWGDHDLGLCVEVGTPDMRGALHEVHLSSRSICDFLDDLAVRQRGPGGPRRRPADDGPGLRHRGWPGVRRWQTDDGDLAIAAEFRPWGHVDLTWTVQPWQRSGPRWNASVVMSLEAGTHLRTLSAAIHGFLHPANLP